MSRLVIAVLTFEVSVGLASRLENGMADVISVPHEVDSGDAIPREWLVTNGLGGFASATVAGEITRRYHGFLIAALPSPLGRVVMLSDLVAEIEIDAGKFVALTGDDCVRDFTLASGLPSWRYAVGDVLIEKSVLLPSHHNIVHVSFTLLEGASRIR